MVAMSPELKAEVGQEKPKAVSGVRVESRGGMGIAVVNQTFRYMNASSAAIYRRLDGRHSISEIVA